MGDLFGGGKVQQIPVTPDRDAAAAEAEKQRRLAANSSGYGSTILTSGSGVQQSGTVGRKTLLGQ